VLNVKQGDFADSAVSAYGDASTERAGKGVPGEVENGELLVTGTKR
jgi:hypothetical protein